MADSLYFPPTSSAGPPLKLVDNRDGTYALGVAMLGGTAGSGGEITATTIPQQLAPTQSCTEVFLQVDTDATVDVYVGFAAAQPIRLSAGMFMNLTLSDPSLLYVVTLSGTALVRWLVRD